MFEYLAKRIGQAIIALWAVITISFALVQLVPGGPEAYFQSLLREEGIADDVTIPTELIQDMTNMDPSDPIYIQYLDYLSAVIIQGDLGRSIRWREPVTAVIADALPWTIFLMTMAVIVTFATGIVLGGFMAYWEGSRFDSSVTLINIFVASIPNYVFALLLLGVLAFQFNLFPLSGRVNENLPPGFNAEFIASIVHHAILPFLAMIIAGFGGPALAMRGNAIQVLGAEYIRVARLRGLSETRIATRYVTRNAVLPLYTLFMISLASFFSGAVIIEEIFGYRGMGFIIVQAFVARDVPVLMAGFILLSAVTIVGVLLADLTYGLIDPRVKTGDTDESF